MVIGSLGSLRSSRLLGVTVLRILGHKPIRRLCQLSHGRKAWGQTQMHEVRSHKQDPHESPRAQEVLVEITWCMPYGIEFSTIVDGFMLKVSIYLPATQEI